MREEEMGRRSNKSYELPVYAVWTPWYKLVQHFSTTRLNLLTVSYAQLIVTQNKILECVN